MSKKFRLFRNGELVSFLKDSNDSSNSQSELVYEIHYQDENSGHGSNVEFYKKTRAGATQGAIAVDITTNGSDSEGALLYNLIKQNKPLTAKIEDIVTWSSRPNVNNLEAQTKFHNILDNKDDGNWNAFGYLNSNRNTYING